MADKQDQSSGATSAVKESSNDPKNSSKDEKPIILFEYLIKFKIYLLDQTNFSGQLFEKIESTFGAPKSAVLLILILSSIAALIFSSDRKAEFLTNVLTIPYLAVCSSRALFRETGCPKCDDTMKWLFAWILLLQLDVSERILRQVPCFWLMKTILLMVIYHPPTDFLTSLFNGWAKPLLYVARGKSDREVYANADPKLLSCFHLTPEMIRRMDEEEIKLHIGLLKMAVNSVFKQRN